MMPPKGEICWLNVRIYGKRGNTSPEEKEKNKRQKEIKQKKMN